jgi:aryl-alcohol dehydrogenase-like predicted oxidoreductase
VNIPSSEFECRIPGTNIISTRLGYGTASIHHRFGSAARQRLLRCAFEQGIRHFDTAPYYAHGLAEHELGRFLNGRRSQAIVATKVGIPANALFRRHRGLMYGKKLIGALGIRGGRPRHYLSLTPQDFAKAAEASMRSSLEALMSDYVDILLLHEPPTEQLELADEILSWFSDVKRRGCARAIGIAGDASTASRLFAQNRELWDLLQVGDSVDRHEADAAIAAKGELQITYGYLRQDQGSGHGSSTVEAALLRNTRGVVLFSTRQEHRIVRNCQTARAVLRRSK